MFGRKDQELWEENTLSSGAARSGRTRGRRRPEEECAVRNAFQRDRDRIIHSKAFRRLKHKTQVFLAPEGDHYRTRLTHTLEVAQIARTVARALRLHEDLTEAIALGHDLGHTPFGHSGEEALNSVHPGGFCHHRQSLRVVEHLEGTRGLNLTWEVRDGIAHHTGNNRASTLEGQTVAISDRVAYINHDIDDAMRAGVLAPEELPPECWRLGNSHGQRITCMVKDLVHHSWDRTEISMSPGMTATVQSLRSFLFTRVYTNSRAKGEEGKAKDLVCRLYEHYLRHPRQLPWEISDREDAATRVVDYIAGMTDRYAISSFTRLFVPLGFSLENRGQLAEKLADARRESWDGEEWHWSGNG